MTLTTAALLVVGCSASTTSNKPNADGNVTTTMVGGQDSLAYTTTQMLGPTGADKANGLEIAYNAIPSNSANMLAALMNRSADFAVPAPQATLDAIEQGADLVLVAVPIHLNASLLVLRADVAAAVSASIPPNASIEERIRALKGLKIATSPAGSGNDGVLRTMVRGAGLDPDRDLQIIGASDKSAIVAGIQAGTFDGALYSNGVLEQNVVNGDAVEWISTAKGDADSILGANAPGLFVVTRRDVVENSPDVVSRVYESMNTVLENLHADPQNFGLAVKEEMFPKMNPEVFDLAWDATQLAYPETATITRDHINKLVALQGREYKNLDYDKIVYDGAREK